MGSFASPWPHLFPFIIYALLYMFASLRLVCLHLSPLVLFGFSPLACFNPTESGAGRHSHPPIGTAVTQVHPPLQGEGFPLAFKVAGQGSTQQVP